MPNEVKITVTGEDKSASALGGADKNVQKLEKSTSSLADKGLSKAQKGMQGLANGFIVGRGVLDSVTGAAETVNKVMSDGIAVGLAKANAQVALGDKGFAALSASAAENANQMGLTQTEFLAMGGKAASLAKNLGFSQEAAADFGAALPTLGSRLSILSNGQVSAADAADQLRSAIAGEFDPLQAMGIAISAASVQTEAMAIQQKSATKISQQQATAMAVLAIVQRQTADASKVMGTEAGRSAREAAEAQAKLKESYQDLEAAVTPTLAKITAGLGDELDSIRGVTDGSVSLRDRTKELSDTLVNFLTLGLPVSKVMDKIFGRKDQVDEHAAAVKGDAVNIDKLSDGAKTAAASQEDLAKATQDAVDAIKDQVNIALDGRDAARGYQQALDDATESLHDNGKTLDITTEKGRANSQALDAIARAALAQADAVKDAGGSEEDYRGQLERSRAALERQAIRFGMTKEQARAYSRQILGIPHKANTKVTLDSAGAIRKIDAVRIKIAKLDGSVAYVTIKATTYRSAVDIGQSRGEHAAGGPVGAATGGARGGLTLVGEDGPELVDLSPGTMVHTAANSRAMMRRGMAGGGGVAHGVLEIRSGGTELDELLLMILQRVVRRNGGNVQVVFGTRSGATTAR